MINYFDYLLFGLHMHLVEGQESDCFLEENYCCWTTQLIVWLTGIALDRPGCFSLSLVALSLKIYLNEFPQSELPIIIVDLFLSL